MRRAKEHQHPLSVTSSLPPYEIEGTAALADEWLTSVVRQSLQSSFGNLEPPQVVWDRVQRHILRSPQRAGQGAGVKLDQQDPRRCAMLDWTDVLANQERFKDMEREAQRYRFVQQALAGRERHSRLYHRTLTWLGQRLIVWGGYLQERYGAAAATPALCAADHT